MVYIYEKEITPKLSYMFKITETATGLRFYHIVRHANNVPDYIDEWEEESTIDDVREWLRLRGYTEKIVKQFYRLRYKDGTHGAWTSDFKRISKDALFFGAKIETRDAK